MPKTYTVEFEETLFEPVEVPAHENLAEHLHACNSPILFGCRSGLCGTCLVDIKAGTCLAPTVQELEALSVYAEGLPNARLACQIWISDNIRIKNIGH